VTANRDREERIRLNFNVPYTLMGYHSITCACEDCLDTDLGISLRGGQARPEQFDLRGIK
jgi:hypothetical protein